MYSITIKTCGNPDRFQDPDKPLMGVPTTVLASESMEGLRLLVQDFQTDNFIGSGNWINPKVLHNGVVVGVMSFNCKLWEN
jgi:hypothetical protein